MSTLTTRAFIACVSITSTVLFAPAATAQLRQHPVVAGMGPTQFDIEPEPDFIDQPNFGAAVAIRNGVAFVGIPGIRGGQGGVRIFTQSSTGAWVNSGTLTVSGAWELGRSLTFRDGVLVAGAASLDSKPNAYVFRRVNGVWTQTQKLTRRQATTSTRSRIRCVTRMARSRLRRMPREDSRRTNQAWSTSSLRTQPENSSGAPGLPATTCHRTSSVRTSAWQDRSW